MKTEFEEIIVLFNLSQKDGHLYRIKKEVQKQFGFSYTFGSMHSILVELENRGLAKSEWTMGKFNRPIKLYKLTQEGKNFFNTKKQELTLLIRTLTNGDY